MQALKPRRTSSTQTSSNVIHAGFACPRRLGLTDSQKSSDRMFLYLCVRVSGTHHNHDRTVSTHVAKGLTDHRPLIAKTHSLSALVMTEPVGGRIAYFLRIRSMMAGQHKNRAVGRRNDSQYPTYFSAYTIPI